MNEMLTQANAAERSNEAAAEIVARLRAEKQATAAAREKGLKALREIETAINRNPGTGQCERLVSFLLALFDGHRYPFDLRDLRGLDTSLARACLDYLELDTRGLDDVENYLADGKQWLLAQRDFCGITADEPAAAVESAGPAR